MKRNTVIFLALGCAFSAAGPLYAADSGGMTNDSAKTYQNAVDNCQKKNRGGQVQMHEERAQGEVQGFDWNSKIDMHEGCARGPSGFG